MKCGYSFLSCLFRFLLLIEESLFPFRHARTFMMATIQTLLPDPGYHTGLPQCKEIAPRVSNTFVKVLNRIFAVLVKANPSREVHFNGLNTNVKAFV